MLLVAVEEKFAENKVLLVVAEEKFAEHELVMFVHLIPLHHYSLDLWEYWFY